MSQPKRSAKPYGSQITTPSPSWLSPLDDAGTAPTAESSVKLSEIHLPTQQPRRYFDRESLQALVESVKQHGILQPLLVRPLDSGGYELVAGERRYRAATEAGLTEVPVVIRSLNNQEALQLALIENLLREDLNPVEETEGILQLLALQLNQEVASIPPLLHRLQKELQRAATRVAANEIELMDADEPTAANALIDPLASKAEVSNNVIGNCNDEQLDEAPDTIANEESGLSAPEKQVVISPELQTIEAVFNGLGGMTWESFINNRLPLLNLPVDVLEVLRSGKLEYTKAKVIAQIKDEPERTRLLTEAIDNHLSLSQIKEKIKAIQLQPSASPPSQTATELPERLKVVTQRIRKTRIWSDPKKCKQLEALLVKLEALVGEE